ncbi:hypothetical protein KDL44_10165 [bacterium]|nr:hypothetical protein [bacterium]
MAICCLLLLAGCGGSGSQATADLSSGNRLEQLQALLEAELAQSDSAAARSGNAAPSAGNSVFDLQASLSDTGDGMSATVQLRWTERLVGDYDRNGLVNAADLVPLAQHFGETVSYRSVLETDGIEGWPTGLAFDPAASGNWRLARIDGNADGLIDAADVTPIAQHWQQSLSGYRVYRRHGGQDEPTLLPDPLDPGSALSVSRSSQESGEGQLPLSYSFSDLLQDAGEYLYFVVPYDIQSATEGPASRAVTPLLNSPPLAVISASPLSGMAPLQVQLDGSASSDAEGPIALYEWDLDGNGSFELTGIDPDSETTLAEGSHSIRLRVTDAQGAVDTTQVQVEVYGSLVPVISANRTEDQFPGSIVLSAAESSSGLEIAYCEWFLDFTVAPAQVTEMLFDYSPEIKTPGYHNVRLQLTDVEGAQRSASIDLLLVSGSDDSNWPRITTDKPEDSLPASFLLSSQFSEIEGSLERCEWYAGLVPLVGQPQLELQKSTSFLSDLLLNVSEPGNYLVELVLTINGHEYERQYSVYAYVAPQARISPDKARVFLGAPALFSAVNSAGSGLNYIWDIDPSWIPGDSGTFEADIEGPYQISIDTLAVEQFPVSLKVIDRFGKSSSDAALAEVMALPELVATLDATDVLQGSLLQLDIGFSNQWEGLVDGWRVSFSGSANPPQQGQTFPATIAIPCDITGIHQLELEILQSQIPGSVPELQRSWEVSVSLFEPGFSTDADMGNAGTVYGFDASQSMGSQPITSYSWDWDSDGSIDESSASPLASHAFPAGVNRVTLHISEAGGHSNSVQQVLRIYPGPVSIIRNDGGLYQANLDAITSDLDSIGISWQILPYSDNLLVDASSEEIYIWYRGGPGSAVEPAPHPGIWTSTEIDNYLGLLELGKRVLLMSQSHGKDYDIVIDPSEMLGWSNYFGLSELPASVPKPEYRMPWTAGLNTDDGIGWVEIYGYVPSSPTNLSRDGGITLTNSGSWDSAEGYLGQLGSGHRMLQLEIGDCHQLCGIGYPVEYFQYHGNEVSDHMRFGCTAPEYGREIFGVLSYGNLCAPVSNIGWYPDYAVHVNGPGRLWVVGYPWAEVQITDSDPDGMSRAELLHNMLGWLTDDGLQLQP